MVLWMSVTNDEYELPVAVADTAAELADYVGVSRCLIYKYAEDFANGRRKKSPYIKVKI